MSSDAENRRQVEAMLSEALDIARREGGVGVEIHLLTADGISCFKWFNLPDDYGLADMQHVGGGAVMDLDDVCALYDLLLSHPHDEWRASNQWAYCLLRDEIADRTDRDAEFVQTSFEEMAAHGRR